MYNYHGYWFYHVPTDKIVQAKDLTEEYCILNCPQEYEGPFITSLHAHQYRAKHPTAHKDYLQWVEDYQRFCNGEYN